MFYQRIMELCKAGETTPTALCTKITGSPGNLSTWKKGNARNDHLVKIAQYFGVSTDYLLTGKEPLAEQELSEVNTAEKPKIIVPPELKNILTASAGGKSDITQEEVDEMAEFWRFVKSKRKDKHK